MTALMAYLGSSAGAKAQNHAVGVVLPCSPVPVLPATRVVMFVKWAVIEALSS